MTRIYLLLVTTLVVVAASPFGKNNFHKDTSHCCKVGDWDSCFCLDTYMAGICIDKRCYGCRKGCKAKQK
ncbi:hypothetical protein KP79_PYT16375 [Mizuhopecten yessoensis]|uniref:Bowman-Birk serine protease inhibitors family domain-containing protein n=1 Tax=Mizuhopecten yessoensis TaxID=6573 RepID=A0A210PYN5_MIZYE|nr:hypothetical protein KP79_PYT16375 [Mizuhopecten yessoensis]